MWDLFLHNAGMLYWAVVLGAWIVAYYETFWVGNWGVSRLGRPGFFREEFSNADENGRPLTEGGSSGRKSSRAIDGRWVREAAQIAGWLGLIQLLALLVFSFRSDMVVQTFICWELFVCILPVFGLWVSGKTEQSGFGWPSSVGVWSFQRKFGVSISLWAAGMVLTRLLLMAIDIKPGEFVQQMMTENGSDVALNFIVVWSLLNAPWVEELTFRHYLLPRFARLFGGGKGAVWLALVLTSAIFACGHALHTVPAWPKLVQVMAFGLLLGWTRIRMGTAWSIGLHLVWNLSALLMTMFDSVYGGQAF